MGAQRLGVRHAHVVAVAADGVDERPVHRGAAPRPDPVRRTVPLARAHDQPVLGSGRARCPSACISRPPGACQPSTQVAASSPAAPSAKRSIAAVARSMSASRPPAAVVAVAVRRAPRSPRRPAARPGRGRGPPARPPGRRTVGAEPPADRAAPCPASAREPAVPAGRPAARGPGEHVEVTPVVADGGRQTPRLATTAAIFSAVARSSDKRLLHEDRQTAARARPSGRCRARTAARRCRRRPDRRPQQLGRGCVGGARRAPPASASALRGIRVGDADELDVGETGQHLRVAGGDIPAPTMPIRRSGDHDVRPIPAVTRNANHIYVRYPALTGAECRSRVLSTGEDDRG